MSNTIQLRDKNGNAKYPITDSSLVIEGQGTVHEALAQKYEKPAGGIPASDLASGVIPTVPTISTNIATDKSSTTKTASPSAVYNEVHPAIATTQPAGGFLPNVVYDLGTITGTVTFALASATDNTIANPYFWTFETSSTAPTITWPANLTWAGGSAPTINASKHYEIMVRNGYATSLEF